MALSNSKVNTLFLPHSLFMFAPIIRHITACPPSQPAVISAALIFAILAACDIVQAAGAFIFHHLRGMVLYSLSYGRSTNRHNQTQRASSMHRIE
jgi:hypothetical protein